jgi:hypothetical protein
VDNLLQRFLSSKTNSSYVLITSFLHRNASGAKYISAVRHYNSMYVSDSLIFYHKNFFGSLDFAFFFLDFATALKALYSPPRPMP